MIVKENREELETYLTDASNYAGDAEKLYIPENEEELINALKDCCNNRTPITLRGAGTGLTGASVPESGAIISMEKLNKIISIDTDNKIAKVQPGVIVADLQKELNQLGYFYPPNPTEKNSALGGNIAANASGSRTFKYGATRKFVQSMKIILANGDELLLDRNDPPVDSNKMMIESCNGNNYEITLPDIQMPKTKHVAGFYIKRGMQPMDLFIGSEGVLGIVTEAELRFIKAPEKVLGGIVFFDDEERLLDFVIDLREKSRQKFEVNSADIEDIAARLIEFFDSNALDLLREFYPQIPDNSVGAIWFEQEYAQRHEDILLEKWMRYISGYSNLAGSTWIAMESHEHERFAEFRHTLPLQVNEIFLKSGLTKLGTDTAVPDEKLKDFYYFIKKSLINKGLNHIIFSHIGNTHIHANIFSKNQEERRIAEALFHEILKKSLDYGGTISGEHGVGKIKKDLLRQMFGDRTIGEMKQIKQTLDPYYLLGQGTLFD